MENELKLQTKIKWKTPELIILVRSKPEDAVLVACRGSGGSQYGSVGGCIWIGCLGDCNALSVS